MPATSRVSLISVVPLPSSSPGRGFLVVSAGKNCKNISVNFTAGTGRCRIRLLLPPQTGRFAKEAEHQLAQKRTWDAESKDSFVLFHQPLQQSALPCSRGATQHHGPRSRHRPKSHGRTQTGEEGCLRDLYRPTRFTGGELWCLSGALP